MQNMFSAFIVSDGTGHIWTINERSGFPVPVMIDNLTLPLESRQLNSRQVRIKLPHRSFTFKDHSLLLESFEPESNYRSHTQSIISSLSLSSSIDYDVQDS